ncbi:CG42360, partial [Drosophila busckii]
QAAVKVVKAATPKRLRMSESLFTSTERKKLLDYNSNTYNPGEDDSIPTNHKRFIIIDGSNVAFGHGCSKVFSAEGIKYSLEYFETLGHSVKAVIPQFRKNPHKSTNPALLDQLYKDGKIVFTPCKNLPTQQSISYDDRFILQLAYERNAAVVSNDNYRDLIHENPAFKKIVENRVIGYSWCDNIFILPKDPYGRFGPQLAEILRC